MGEGDDPPAVNVAAREVRGGIHGFCLPGFEPVANAFADNFSAHGEVGAAACLIHRGRVVVDLWGGLAAVEPHAPWTSETLVIPFSCTKAATALCLHLLEERGGLDLDRPIMDVWPAFAAKGKEAGTARMVLDHTIGLPAIRQPLKVDCLLDHEYMAGLLAAEEPFWEPGARLGYHPVTMGFLAAEIIRRVDGRTLGAFFAQEIARPLGLEFWIGLPDEQDRRSAQIIQQERSPTRDRSRFANAARTTGTIQNLVTFNHGDWSRRGVNTREGRAAEIGAAGGSTNARSLAKLYSALVPGGPLGFGAHRLIGFGRASSATHLDATLLQPTRFGPGFMLRMDNRRHGRGDSFLIGDDAFGHVGAGGSVGFADPRHEIGFAYVMNRMGSGFLLNDRGHALIESVYTCLERDG